MAKDERANLDDQLVEAWRINNRANLLLLEAISDAGLESTMSQRGGRTVAQQLAHLHNVRIGWLEVCSPPLARQQKKVDAKQTVTRKLLLERLAASADAVADMLGQSLADGGKLRGFKRGPVVLAGYLIAHDAHHRGNILLTLKLSGHPVAEQVRYGIWEWGRL
jgi:uncharacterized damage-inducible protein DinB